MKLMMVIGGADFNPLQLGGGGRGNRFLCEGLAARGHSVLVVMPSFNGVRRRTALDELRAQGTEIQSDGASGGLLRFRVNGVQVEAVNHPFGLLDHMRTRIAEQRPDRIIVTLESSAYLLDAVVANAPSPPYYLAHDVFSLPFGPYSATSEDYNRERKNGFQQFAGVLAVSEFVGDCVRAWGGGVRVEVARLPVYGARPFPRFGDFDNGLVTLVNPCAYKGIDIFLELARTMPSVQFAAVAGWETGRSDLIELSSLPNVRLLEAHPDIDRVMRQTRILLLPSLVHEGLPLIVNEAMLRGIPVIASDVGGVPEAMHGNDYLLPVNPIVKWVQDERCGWSPVIPAQDAAPWRAVLHELVQDRALYARCSTAARDRALSFVSSLGVEPFERFMGLA